MKRLARRVLLGGLTAYQRCVTPFTPPTCRFHPTCSEYARQAIEVHGALKGSWLAVRRVGRCHPFGGQGYDPVPAAHGSRVTVPPGATDGSGEGVV